MSAQYFPDGVYTAQDRSEIEIAGSMSRENLAASVLAAGELGEFSVDQIITVEKEALLSDSIVVSEDDLIVAALHDQVPTTKKREKKPSVEPLQLSEVLSFLNARPPQPHYPTHPNIKNLTLRSLTFGELHHSAAPEQVESYIEIVSTLMESFRPGHLTETDKKHLLLLKENIISGKTLESLVHEQGLQTKARTLFDRTNHLVAKLREVITSDIMSEVTNRIFTPLEEVSEPVVNAETTGNWPLTSDEIAHYVDRNVLSLPEITKLQNPRAWKKFLGEYSSKLTARQSLATFTTIEQILNERFADQLTELEIDHLQHIKTVLTKGISWKDLHAELGLSIGLAVFTHRTELVISKMHKCIPKDVMVVLIGHVRTVVPADILVPEKQKESRPKQEPRQSTMYDEPGIKDSKFDRVNRRSSSGYNNDAVSDYLREVGRHELLTAAEEVVLAKTIERALAASKGLDTSTNPLERRQILREIREGQEAKSKFFHSNLRLVVSIAKKYPLPTGMELMDLIQEGNLSMNHAIDKYDWRKGFKFSTYATFWIRQGIGRYLDTHGSMIHLPSVQAASMRASLRLVNGEGNQLSGTEAENWKLSTTVSLNKTVGDDGETEYGDMIANQFKGPEETVVESEMGTAIQEVVRTLDAKTAYAVEARFGFLEDGSRHSLKEIGEHLGITAEASRRLIGRALERLKNDPAVLEKLMEA